MQTDQNSGDSNSSGLEALLLVSCIWNDLIAVHSVNKSCSEQTHDYCVKKKAH